MFGYVFFANWNKYCNCFNHISCASLLMCCVWSSVFVMCSLQPLTPSLHSGPALLRTVQLRSVAGTTLTPNACRTQGRSRLGCLHTPVRVWIWMRILVCSFELMDVMFQPICDWKAKSQTSQHLQNMTVSGIICASKVASKSYAY